MGLPRILSLFRAYNIKALFFVSAELLRDHRHRIWEIKEAGHEVGAHGIYHEVFKAKFRYTIDREISKAMLASINPGIRYYRAPKFGDGTIPDLRLVGLLKYMWGVIRMPEDPIFYLHPFDIVKSKAKPPNLFCRLWYARPDKAWQTLVKLLECYPGELKLR